MLSPAPVAPEQGRRADDERMQEHAHLTRLRGSAAIPLALLTQGTRTTTEDASPIHHAQAAIGFSALLMREQLLVSRATQRPIGLESKVLAREATRFPGQTHVRGSIARGRSRARWKRWSGGGRRDGRSKLGRAHGIRMQLMPQLQAQVPHPLRDQLPAFLSPGRVRAPAIGILFVVFI
jgi:hypothetical protein